MFLGRSGLHDGILYFVERMNLTKLGKLGKFEKKFTQRIFPCTPGGKVLYVGEKTHW